MNRLDSSAEAVAQILQSSASVQDQKQRIRRLMKARRLAESDTTVMSHSAEIVRRLLAREEVTQAESIGLFWPLLDRKEVDLRALDQELRAQDKRLFYPYMEKMPSGRFGGGFRLTRSQAELQRRSQNFAEPDPAAPEARAGELELVIVPALAVDARGHRTGYGAGYYDGVLSGDQSTALAVVVAFEFQRVARLPVEGHDRPASLVVTDAGAERFAPG